MGAYVSTENCKAHYGVTPNCTVEFSENNATALRLGESEYGSFPGDPDIAGAGVLGAFLCVTVVSLLLAIVSTAWWAAKNVFGVVNRLTREEKANKNWQISVAGIVEALIVTCSDQQVFTGGAYAITLRYAKACSVSAYHYNIVANILLVTCATHLMAVTIARHYWQHPYVGVLRITVTTLVYVITGVLLSNQGSGSMGFPTEVPRYTDRYSLMLLPAACFQTGEFLLDTEVKKAFKAGSAEEFFTGQIHGWPNFLIMFMFYIIAVGMSLGRIVRRGQGHKGKRRRLVTWLRGTIPWAFKIRRFFYAFFGLYLVAGIALSGWTVAIAAIYVMRLRRWVDKSGWIGLTHNSNPENDPSTFGQLVPLLLMSLTVFTFLQIVSERIHARRDRAKRREYASLHGRRRSDSRSISPSSRTRYSTISVVDVGGSMHEGNNTRRESDQQHQLYDYPYNDKHKSEPVVGVRAVEEREPATIDIGDTGTTVRSDQPPLPPLPDGDDGDDPQQQQQQAFLHNEPPHYLAQDYPQSHIQSPPQPYSDIPPQTQPQPNPSQLPQSPAQAYDSAFIDSSTTPSPRRHTTDETKPPPSPPTPPAAIGLKRGGSGGGRPRQPSASPPSSSTRKMGLFERMSRAREEKRRRKAEVSEGEGENEGESMVSGDVDVHRLGGVSPPLGQGQGVYDAVDGRQSAMSLPVGVGAGFPVGAQEGGSWPASGEWFVQGSGRRSLSPPAVGGGSMEVQEYDIGMGLGMGMSVVEHGAGVVPGRLGR